MKHMCGNNPVSPGVKVSYFTDTCCRHDFYSTAGDKSLEDDSKRPLFLCGRVLLVGFPSSSFSSDPGGAGSEGS